MSKIDPLEKDRVNVNDTQESCEKRYCPTSDLALYELPAELPASADSGCKQLADSSPLANWNGFPLHGDVDELDKIVSTPGLLALDK